MKFKIANVLAICVVLTAGFIFLMFGKRSAYSETEKRELTEKPKFSVGALVNGNYTEGLTEYYSDTVPNRTKFLYLNSDILATFGISVNDVEIIGGNGNLNADPVEETEEITTTQPPVTTANSGAVTSESAVTTEEIVTTVTEPIEVPLEFPDEDGVLENGVIITKDTHRAMPRFGAGKSEALKYAEYLNTFKANVGDINVFSMVVPTAQTFYIPKNYANTVKSEPDFLQYARDAFTGVKDVNILPILEEHKNEEIYLRTDHHWAALGAYYAASVFAEEADLYFPDLSTYEKISREGYVGSMYGYSKSAVIKDNPETFVYYKPANYSQITAKIYNKSYQNPQTTSFMWEDCSVSNSYMIFMGSDDKVNDISTNVSNGRTLLILKDSYGNAIQPFLTQSFERILTVDIRYFNLNIFTFLQQQNVTDVLFCMNTFSAGGGNSKGIQRIMSQ